MQFQRHEPISTARPVSRSLFWLRLGAILLTAVSQPLLSAPFNWWPLHWIAWIPFLWAVAADGGRARLRLAYIGGTAANLMIFYWMVRLLPNFTNIPLGVSLVLVFLLCSYLSITWIVLAWVVPRLRRRYPVLWIYATPAVLVALEFLLPQLFPYMQGASHYRVLPVAQLASLTGVYGISYLLFLANTVLFNLLAPSGDRRKTFWAHPLILALLVGLVLIYGRSRVARYHEALQDARVLRVGLIQSNLQPFDHSRLGFNHVQDTYMKLSQQAVARGARWVVWSEGEFKYALNTGLARGILLEMSRELGCPILLGGYGHVMKDGKVWTTNSAIHVDPSTGLGRRYDKRILVPFGETMPLERQLRFITRHIDWKSRFHPGDEPVVQTLDGIPYAFLICYEAIYPRLGREAVSAGAHLLVNITYDAWFGRTTAPHQHLMLAVIRCIETGLPMVRLATSGISTVANPLGETDGLSPLFERKVLIHRVPLVVLPTLYAKTGDLFAWFCVAGGLLCLTFTIVGHSRRRRRQQPVSQ